MKVAQSCLILLIPWTCSPTRDSPGKNTGVGCHSLLQGIFPNQRLNTSLPHSRKILYHLSHQESLASNKTSLDSKKLSAKITGWFWSWRPIFPITIKWSRVPGIKPAHWRESIQSSIHHPETCLTLLLFLPNRDQNSILIPISIEGERLSAPQSPWEAESFVHKKRFSSEEEKWEVPKQSWEMGQGLLILCFVKFSES